MKKIFFITVIFFGILKYSAQNIDSLKKALNSAKQDTAKINTLMQLVESISDDDVWPMYNDQLLKISEKLVNSKNALFQRKAKIGLADA